MKIKEKKTSIQCFRSLPESGAIPPEVFDLDMAERRLDMAKRKAWSKLMENWSIPELEQAGFRNPK